MKNLFSIFLLFAAVLAASSCGTVRQTCPFSQSDSTRVEVKTQTVTKTDTVTVELPVIIERNVTLDTLSRLENAYAKSEAKVTNGFLHHSLETKPVKLPVEVKTETVYKDSLVYRDRLTTRTVEVERKLTWWQKARMHAGTATFILLAFAILYLLLKSINPLNLKRL